MIRIIVISVIVLCGILVWRFFTIPFPAQQNIVSKLNGSRKYSHTTYADTLVSASEINAIKIYRSFFAPSPTLKSEETQEVLRILSEPSNYHSSPPELTEIPEMIFIYQTRDGTPLGESYLNSDGEIVTAPPQLLGSPGYLNDSGIEQLKRVIQ